MCKTKTQNWTTFCKNYYGPNIGQKDTVLSFNCLLFLIYYNHSEKQTDGYTVGGFIVDRSVYLSGISDDYCTLPL